MFLGILKRTLADPWAVLGLTGLCIIALTAIFADQLAAYDPMRMVGRPLAAPVANPRFPLGTDTFGRDVLSGVIHGSRVSLAVGLSAALLCFLIGTPIGAICGYFGGMTDRVLTRVTELFQTIPSFLFVLILVTIMGPSLWGIVLSIAAIAWVPIARIARAEFRSLREKEYVMASRSMGYGHLRIMMFDILPAALPPIIVTTTMLVATAILEEAALSFLGMGDPNNISWGTMIGNAREVVRSAPILILFPGAAIVLTLLFINLFADALSDAVSPSKAKI